MVAPAAPEIAMMVLDLLFEQSDMPNRQEIVKRIRQMTGMKDPDADPNKPPSPEEQAQEAQKAEQQALEKRAVEAKIALDEAGALQKAATAGKAKADADNAKASMATLNVATLSQALELALASMQVPQAAVVADQILTHAGYKPPADGAAMPPGAMPPNQGMQQGQMPPQMAASPVQPPMPQGMPPQGA